MGLFRDFNINKVIVSSILVSRWNAKMALLENRKQILTNRNLESSEINAVIDEVMEKYSYLQSNLTEKFLRIFRRLAYHHSTMMVSSIPFELSSDLELSIIDMDNICNNKLLDEIYNFDFRGMKKNLNKK